MTKAVDKISCSKGHWENTLSQFIEEFNHK